LQEAEQKSLELTLEYRIVTSSRICASFQIRIEMRFRFALDTLDS